MMKNFDVYKLWPIEPVRASGSRIWDSGGREYLDFYGGHAVLSIGHGHPRYVSALCAQVSQLGFYSNSVMNPLQQELAERLGTMSGYGDYSLFLSNSGAEANENALKLASFHTGKNMVLAFLGAFHGRTSGAVAVTDNPAIISPYNSGHRVTFVPLNDIAAVEQELATGQYAAVIIEGIQGVAGMHSPWDDFLRQLREATQKHGAVLILDEIQSGYGRTGRFFAHQYANIRPDIITTAKGMGNGFPIGGTLISPAFEPVPSRLGTTFGGNHLACAAGIAVLAVMEDEGLVGAAAGKGEYLLNALRNISARYPGAIADIRGRGLMIGIEMSDLYGPIRDALLFEDRIFTGGAGKNVIRLLPPLSIPQEDIDLFLAKFERQLNNFS